MLASKSCKYFTKTLSASSSQTPGPHFHEIKSFCINARQGRKQGKKRCMTTPYSDDGNRNADGKISTGKGKQRFDGGSLSKRKMMVKSSDSFFLRDKRVLTLEFPMMINVGSIYSSHVIIYLDP
ncbi:hypothetical protein Phum_PHUM397270 [Pediculus humanus corporis]|uniref:Uncharacterized protein n=1 Tax=Pediculus humanus subsp. corporis TaxID=121224 RepID=E0VRE4_PEDHC|nr:uncharacterized protein Phum_PHUM397270 [Pediculus humanus corporis]EEB15950.1 hypothetical protein Phum_PHUM397270 [Pediculus humanus corporis]